MSYEPGIFGTFNSLDEVARFLSEELRVISDWVNRAHVVTGTYTGDGATSQQIVVQDDLEPLYVKIWRQRTSDGTDTEVYEAIAEHITDGPGAVDDAGLFQTNTIISLNVDGFTVDDAGADASPNTNGVVYNYMVIR